MIKQTLSQLGLGFIISVVLAAWTYVLLSIYLSFRKARIVILSTQPKSYPKAELRTGGWNYYDDFFNQVEEFRNDFA